MKEVAQRGIDRAARQLRKVLEEERTALERPLEESEQRLAGLEKAIERAEQALADLGSLLSAEQQKLALELGERRKRFLMENQARAQEKLAAGMKELRPGWNGAAYRRQVMHRAQAVARKSLEPWLAGEAHFAAGRVERITGRFREMGNEYLQKLRESGASGGELLIEDVEGKLAGKPEFRFHVLERMAAPASPFVYAADLLFGWSTRRGAIRRDAADFVVQLLEVNSARVQSDVEDRVAKSRRELEAEIRKHLRGASDVAGRALQHARAAQAGGREAEAQALAELERWEEQLRVWQSGPPDGDQADAERAVAGNGVAAGGKETNSGGEDGTCVN